MCLQTDVPLSVEMLVKKDDGRNGRTKSKCLEKKSSLPKTLWGVNACTQNTFISRNF